VRKQSTSPQPGVLVLTAYYHPFKGGVETHARRLAVHLDRDGFPVVVVTRRARRGDAAVDTVDGLPVHRLFPAGPRTGLRKWGMIPFAVWTMIKLRRQFDLIYCPGYQGIGVAAIVASRLLRRPVVLRSANLGVLAGSNWDGPLARWGVRGDNALIRWLKRRMRNVYLSADAFACNCREIEEEALACRVPRDRVHYLPNAVDVEHFRIATAEEKARIRREHGWPDDVFLCLYVGRLSLEKGVMELLAAWRDVRSERKLLVLVGPDMPGHALDAGRQVRDYVATHRMEKEVLIPGETADVARLLRAGDVYVQPSHYEAFSNSLIEAMATGLPVIASDVGGMRECVVHEMSGLLSRPKSAADIAAALNRLVEDRELRARLGARARQTVLDHFSEATVFKRFAALFAATARPGSPGASVRASGATTA
jgi:glycosyltransferase involved in cell wall biosynthesis